MFNRSSGYIYLLLAAITALNTKRNYISKKNDNSDSAFSLQRFKVNKISTESILTDS